MSRRSNFIEGNDNFRDQNLRFVRNEFEDNINQFFGGANPGGSGQQKAPPRDSIIVQPTPGNNELDNRRQFLRELGASRMLANSLAKRNFNLRQFQRQRYRLSVELGDDHQDVVDKELLRSIEEAVDNPGGVQSRPRTPSPPRNIDWNDNQANFPGNNDRSRPRNRPRQDNIQGRRNNTQEFVEQRQPVREPNNRNSGPIRDANRGNPRGNPEEFNRNNRSNNFGNRNNTHQEQPPRDNSRRFAEQHQPIRGPINKNSGPVNGPINRNRDAEGFNRNNNRNANPQEFNRNNRNVTQQEFNRTNRNAPEINRNENSNAQQFNRPNRNVNPQEFNRSNRNSNATVGAEEYNRNANNNRKFRNNRNANQQDFNPNYSQGNNRNDFNDEFHQNDRNINSVEFNRNNRNISNDEFNQMDVDDQPNIDDYPQGNQNNRYAKPKFSRNTNPEEYNFNKQNENPQGSNRNTNNRGQMANRGKPSNFSNSRTNHNRGSDTQNFVPKQQHNLDRNSIINQRSNIGENFQMSGDRFVLPDNRLQQQQHINEDIDDMNENNRRPQTGRNYQRIVNNNQITLCRTDWIEANERNFVTERDFNDDFLEDPCFNDDIDSATINDEHFRGQQHDFMGNQPNFREHSNNGRNSYGRDRNFDGNRRQFDREPDRRNLSDNFNQRNNSSRGVDIQRFPLGEDDTFQGSNDHFQSNQYERGSDSGDRYINNPQSGDPIPSRQTGPNQNRRNFPNAKRLANAGGPNQSRTNSSQRISSLDRTYPGGPNKPRSNSLTENRNATKVPDGPYKNQGRPNLNQGRGGKPNSRVTTQNKPNQPESLARNTNPDPTRSGQQATKNITAMAKPRAGRKRDAESVELGVPNRANNSEPKRRKVNTSRNFIIGGIRLPYIMTNRVKLPQEEEESYAVTFFEQTPIYNTNIYATHDGDIYDEEDEEEMSDTDSLDSNRSDTQSKFNAQSPARKLRVQLRKEWTKVYRTNNYKDWRAWWKDYKWCGNEINKNLEKFGDRSVRNHFAPAGNKITDQVITHIFKQGHMGLLRNTFNHYRDMRSIFQLMNENFLANLSEEQMQELQDLIRGIPNHLWLYKIRSMLFLWERYHGTLKHPTPKNLNNEKEFQSIVRVWKNPAFHWLAKQAFDELKAISEIAWPDHNKIYPHLKS